MKGPQHDPRARLIHGLHQTIGTTASTDGHEHIFNPEREPRKGHTGLFLAIRHFFLAIRHFSLVGRRRTVTVALYHPLAPH
jgi:hypothetical protein